MKQKKKIAIGAALAALLLSFLIIFAPQRPKPSTSTQEPDAGSDTPSLGNGLPSGSSPQPEVNDDSTAEVDDKNTENTEEQDEPPSESGDGSLSFEDEDIPSKPEPASEPNDSTPDSITEKAVPDENGMMEINGIWLEAPKPFNADSISNFAKKLNSLRDTYLSEAASINCAIIPDKSFYLKEYTDYYLDHDAMCLQLEEAMPDWSFIQLGDLLSAEDYYVTDAHWRQERIIDSAQRIASRLGFEVNAGGFSKKSQSGFTGDYRRYIGTEITEELCWLESDYTSGASCDNYQRPESTSVYDQVMLSSSSPYDMFLGGPTPLVTVTNPLGDSQKCLIIFRDSFGSSMAPLLLSGYGKITLVDIRYMVSQLLPQYVSFEEADILFLYSAAVVNNSSILR